MKVVGLTGSIGMGKSVLATQARSLGIPVHDADMVVHQLMQPDGAAFAQVQTHFPTAVIDGKIDRKALGTIVFHDPDKRAVLERIIHPLVRQSSAKFIALCRKHRHAFCILDIPLLFELGRDRDMDYIICVSAPKYVQQRRVLARPNMTLDKYNAIVKTQFPDYRKRLLSDRVILSSRGKRHTLNALKKLKKDMG